MHMSRRRFAGGLAAIGAASAFEGAMAQAAPGSTCPFRLSVINDEITQDFEKACEIASHDFNLQWIELRGMWNKNICDLNQKELDESVAILKKYRLRVTDIASPLFKTFWPGAPISSHAEQHDQFHADFDFKRQDEVLDRAIAAAKTFSTRRVRAFDFWRIDDQAPYRAAINDKLREAAVKCEKHGMILLLENEMSCNTATGEESAAVLKAIPNRNFMLNWDPGNAAAAGSVPFPNGWDLLPHGRIGHCHAKDVRRSPDGKYQWEPVGAGIIDWVGQLRALHSAGYHDAVSLETHWRGAGTPEASTRISMKGLKATLAKAGMTC